MSRTADPLRLFEPRVIGTLLAFVGLCGTLFVLIAGWVGGLEAVVRAGPDLAAMMPSTAVALAALFAVHALFGRSGRPPKVTLIGLLMTAAFLPVINLIMLAVGASGLEASFAPVRDTDRMAAGTAILTLVACAATASLFLGSAARQGWTLALSTLGLSTSVAILIAHPFTPGSHYALPGCAEMSIFTAVALLTLFATLLVRLWERNED
ncbi:hypothetical protein [Litorisediminicola beolgyonensis]|uniref:DUF1109 domain-containing protein n=1 Tax=Litorisediminicola beolgyonensis TaxID=1173614 RepID=A0ABW3ZN58_9RHOB